MTTEQSPYIDKTLRCGWELWRKLGFQVKGCYLFEFKELIFKLNKRKSWRDFFRNTPSLHFTYHVVGAVSHWLVPWSGNTLLGVSVTEAASLHYQVINGKVSSGKCFVYSGWIFGLAGTRLAFQQSDSDVGHPQLLLALYPERIQGLPLREGTVDHLPVKKRDREKDPVSQFIMNQLHRGCTTFRF